MAESSAHGIFVAARTRMPSVSLPTPFICTKISVLIRLDASLSESFRLPQRESISSIKMIDGFCSRAIAKSCLMVLFMPDLGGVFSLTDSKKKEKDVPFTFAEEFGNEIGRRDGEEGGVCLGGDRFGQKRFTSSRRLYATSAPYRLTQSREKKQRKIRHRAECPSMVSGCP